MSAQSTLLLEMPLRVARQAVYLQKAFPDRATGVAACFQEVCWRAEALIATRILGAIILLLSNLCQRAKEVSFPVHRSEDHSTVVTPCKVKSEG